MKSSAALLRCFTTVHLLGIFRLKYRVSIGLNSNFGGINASKDTERQGVQSMPIGFCRMIQYIQSSNGTLIYFF